MKNACFIFFLFLLPFHSTAQGNSYDNNPDAGKYASIRGIKLYYETYGNGQPLIMLHGNGGNIASFKHQIPFFAKKFRVIAIDSRLQGKSGGNADTLSYNMMADDFCALLDFLHLNSVYVLGWSDGGNDAILMALRCPQRIKAIAFTGANIVPDSTAMSQEDILDMKKSSINPKLTATERTLNRMMANEPNIPFSELKKITCPVLVMGGDHDMIKTAHTVKIFQSLPQAQLCIFPDSNHGVLIQHPQLFNATVLHFFESSSQKQQ